MCKISIAIEGRKVTAIHGIPVDLYLEVRNYNVGRLGDYGTSEDESGRPCEIQEWRAPE